MLNRELLRLHRRGDRALPCFIDTADPDLLEKADRILTVFRSAAASGTTRGELAESLECFRNSGGENAALIKLAEDSCRFADTGRDELPELRKKLFEKSAGLLFTSDSPEALHKTLADDGVLPELDIYADLPENQVISGFRDMPPAELLQRYNVAQVQGLLLFAQKLVVRTGETAPADLRRCFKYLKFFRLLASITRKGNGFEMEISGPLAIFSNSRKYAVQLAAFLPAVLLLKHYSLAAKVEWKGRVLDLELDESSGLVSCYRNFSAYVPEEIALFHRLFREKVQDWSIVGDTPFLCGKQGEIFFPDLSFQEHATGRILHLELFHRWHRGELEKRLKTLRQDPGLPLVIGVDRSIADEEVLRELSGNDPELARRIFLFRDFPGVERTLKILKAGMGYAG